jgi:hypothetical protein
MFSFGFPLLLLENLTILHHKIHLIQDVNVAQRITGTATALANDHGTSPTQIRC